MKKFFGVVGVLILILVGYSLWGGMQMHKEEQLQEQKEKEMMSEQKQLDGVYVLDTQSSKVVWTGKKKIIKEWVDKGTIGIKSGEVSISNSQSNFENTTGKIVFDMTSIASNKTGTKETGGSPKLDAHLKSEDFFDVAKFSESSFILKKVIPQEGIFILEGDLTIKGITKPVTLASLSKVDFVDGSEEYIEAQGTVTFNRTDFNVRFGSDTFFDNLGNNIIEDEISLDLTLIAKKKTE